MISNIAVAVAAIHNDDNEVTNDSVISHSGIIFNIQQKKLWTKDTEIILTRFLYGNSSTCSISQTFPWLIAVPHFQNKWSVTHQFDARTAKIWPLLK